MDLSVCGSEDSLMSLGRQGMQKMKKPQVTSASAQNRRGPMTYMRSVSLAKVMVWSRRKVGGYAGAVGTFC